MAQKSRLKKFEFHLMDQDRQSKLRRKADLHEYVLLGFLAVQVGIIVGLAAIAFRYMINFTHNAFFMGDASLVYNSYEFMTTSFGWFIFIIPAIGGLIVGLMIKYGAPEAKGHGVPEVMEATLNRGGRIRPRVGLVKSLASAITIGSGGSAGREGPMIQVGAAGGSSLGQYLGLSDEKVRILVGCGASAGVAATFNAPIAGVVFSLELILLEFKTKSFVPLVISSVIATIIAHLFLGNEIAFPIRDIQGEAQAIYSLSSPYELPLYLILGVLAGISALFFMKFFYKIEDAFDRFRIPDYSKPMMGGLLLGIIGLALFQYSGHFYIFGVGYGGLMEVLRSGTPSGDLMLMGLELALFLVLLMFLKMVATSLTLGSGASGGLFAPSLWMGAMLGGAFGIIVNLAFPSIAAPYGAYALVGMAAFFSGASRATLTAIIILFEMTSTYEIILPLMFACVVADAVSRILSRDTIYTAKLRKKGIYYSYDREINILETIHVGQVMVKEVEYVSNDQTLGQVADKILVTGYQGFPCVDSDGGLCGVVTHKDVREALSRGMDKGTSIVEVETQDSLIVTYPDESLELALEKMAEYDLGHMPVVDPSDPRKIVGFLTRKDIITVYKAKARERKDGRT